MQSIFAVALARMVKADTVEEVVAGEGAAATIELVRSKLLPQAGRCPRFSCQTHNDCYMRGCPACSSGGYCLNR